MVMERSSLLHDDGVEGLADLASSGAFAIPGLCTHGEVVRSAQLMVTDSHVSGGMKVHQPISDRSNCLTVRGPECGKVQQRRGLIERPTSNHFRGRDTRLNIKTQHLVRILPNSILMAS